MTTVNVLRIMSHDAVGQLDKVVHALKQSDCEVANRAKVLESAEIVLDLAHDLAQDIV